MDRYFPPDEYAQRLTRVQAEMKRRGFETAVVFGRGGGTTDNCGDILYLSNHYAISGGMDLADLDGALLRGRHLAARPRTAVAYRRTRGSPRSRLHR